MTRDENTRDIKIGADWTIPDESGIGRRTVVRGAAWTVPVVAVAFSTPAAAASACTTSVGINYMELSTPATHNGEPLYGPGNEPFIDITVVNVGTCTIPAGGVRLFITQDNRYVPGYVRLASGWSNGGTGNNDTTAYLRLVSTQELAPGEQMTARQYLRVSSNPPAGYNRTQINASVGVDGNTNSSTTGTRYFYVYGG